MKAKTKIICTIGPSVDTEERIEALIDAGMSVARLNFSHGTHTSHLQSIERLKRAREKKGVPLGILLDTKGPEIRLGPVKEGQFAVVAQQRVPLCKEPLLGDAQGVQITPSLVVDALEVGALVLIDDGYLVAKVVEKTEASVLIEFSNEGWIKSHKGVNLPGVDVHLPAITESDSADLAFGILHGVDLIAASFIRSVEHVLQIKNLLAKQGASSILLLSKIENSLGVHNFDGILQASDGIMVARGDLGVELPLQEVPRLQKMMIRKCMQAGKLVVTATQMLESMIKNPRPTRAEVSDVANAIYDSTSAVMLSAETASGSHPLQAVEMMHSVAVETEKNFDYCAFLETSLQWDFHDISSSVALASVKTAYSAKAKAIFCFTENGSTAQHLSRFRPQMPIVAVTSSAKTYQQMASFWGVIPVPPAAVSTAQDAFSLATAFALKEGIVEEGDLVVVTAGVPFGLSGVTNMMLVESIGDVLVRGVGLSGHRVRGKIALIHSLDKNTLPSIRGRVVVTSRCDSSYAQLMKGALALIVQNNPEDLESERLARHIADTLAIPLIVRANGAMTVLQEDLIVTVDPDKGVIYRG